jgi:hypothetical protein
VQEIRNSSAPPVYCPAPSRETLEAKFPAHSRAFFGGAPPVYRPQNPMVLQPQPLRGKQAAIRIPHCQGYSSHSSSVVQGAMTRDELRNNQRVQALKPQVNTLERHINNGTLARQTLATLRTLRDAVQESIRLRRGLRSLGSDPGHIARIEREEGFETAVLDQIRTKEAAERAAARAAAQAAVSASRAAGTRSLPSSARWASPPVPRTPPPPPS